MTRVLSFNPATMFQQPSDAPLIPVQIKPQYGEGKPFDHEGLSDTGCTQPMISDNLVIKYNYEVYKGVTGLSWMICANGQPVEPVECLGQ